MLAGVRCVLLTSVAALCAPLGAQQLPNIVIVYADDLGYGDLSCYNADAAYRTPHLDRMAKEGVRFTDAHSPSTICSPSRYGLLSGQQIYRSTGRGGGAHLWRAVDESRVSDLGVVKAQPDQALIASMASARSARAGQIGVVELHVTGDPVGRGSALGALLAGGHSDQQTEEEGPANHHVAREIRRARVLHGLRSTRAPRVLSISKLPSGAAAIAGWPPRPRSHRNPWVAWRTRSGSPPCPSGRPGTS